MKVLVVDDEVTMMRLFQQRFRKDTEAGRVSLSFASSGAEALALLDRGLEPELILSDVSMPGMNGLALIRELRSRGFTCPIYLISAYDEEGLPDTAGQRMADGYIPKPLNFDLIRNLIIPPQGN